AALRLMREIGSALSYLHDLGAAHGCVSAYTVWTTPMGRVWILGWQWSVPAAEIPSALAPEFPRVSIPPERAQSGWVATPASDQWQLAALCFQMLTGESPPATEAPPLSLLRPDVP